VFGRRQCAAAVVGGVLCEQSEGSDENFPRMIDADSEPLFVAVSTAVTKPEHPTLPCSVLFVDWQCCCCWDVTIYPFWSVFRTQGFTLMPRNRFTDLPAQQQHGGVDPGVCVCCVDNLVLLSRVSALC